MAQGVRSEPLVLHCAEVGKTIRVQLRRERRDFIADLSDVHTEHMVQGGRTMFTANMRTCFHEHELLQNCCTRTFRTYEHASNMPSNMRTYVDTNIFHEHAEMLYFVSQKLLQERQQLLWKGRRCIRETNLASKRQQLLQKDNSCMKTTSLRNCIWITIGVR